MPMTENEKAAIAAGLWEPGRACDKGWKTCFHGRGNSLLIGDHDIPAPDMRDLANLWRALENRKLEIFRRNGLWLCIGRDFTQAVAPSMSDAVFAALVALYENEHLA